MKRIVFALLLLLPSLAFAAPNYVYQKTIFPTADSTWNLGSSTDAWANVYSDQFCLTADSCITSWPSGSGGGAWPFTPTTNFGASVQSTSTAIWSTAGLQASSTSQFVNANIWGNLTFKSILSKLLATDSSGNVTSTTTIGANLLTGTLATINSTAITAGGTFTITAASSTLLSDTNTFSATTTFPAAQIGSTAQGLNVLTLSPRTGLTTSNSESVGGLLSIRCGTSDILCGMLYASTSGSQRTLSVINNGNDYTGNVLHVRNNGSASALNVLGHPQGKGIVKVASDGVGDANASVLSLDASTSGFLGQTFFAKCGSATNCYTITDSGSNTILRFLSTGLMGIGTTPTYNLDVVGNGHFTTYVDANYYVATSSTVASRFPFASSTAFSNFGTAYFGGSATSTFSSAGVLTLASPLAIASGGTATTTQVTNGVNYYDGTRITSAPALLFNGTNLSIGTSTFGTLLNLNGVANFGTATSTFYSSGGINLTSGCFAVSGTCVGGGSGTPGGSNTQIQYNNSGAFAGDYRFNWDAAGGEVSVGNGTATTSWNATGGTASDVFTFSSGGAGLPALQISSYSAGLSFGAGGANIFIGDGSATTTGINLRSNETSNYALLDTASLATSDKTFTFPNFSGTFCLVSVNCAATTTANTWTGLQTFANATTSLATLTTAWATTLTATSASTTNASASQSFYVNSERVYGKQDKSSPIASSTLAYAGASASATSSMNIWNPQRAITITDLYCKSTGGSAGTTTITIGSGTATSSVVCGSGVAGSATGLSISIAARGNVYMEAGNVSGSANFVTPTISYTSQ